METGAPMKEADPAMDPIAVRHLDTEGKDQRRREEE
jgi:hypothetical protein